MPINRQESHLSGPKRCSKKPSHLSECALAASIKAAASYTTSGDTIIAMAGTAEPILVLHPNLPELYRRRVEALEVALRDLATAVAAAEVLRGLIAAISVFPGARRLRGAGAVARRGGGFPAPRPSRCCCGAGREKARAACAVRALWWGSGSTGNVGCGDRI